MHFRGRSTLIFKSVVELKRLWGSKAFLDDWQPRSPVINRRFGSLICFLRRDWCGEWPEVASIEVRAYVRPSVRRFFIIGTQSDRRVGVKLSSHHAILIWHLVTYRGVRIPHRLSINYRLFFFSTWPYWSLRPMCPRAVKVLTVFHAQPSLKRTLLKLFTCSCVYRLCRPFVSASTRRFQKIM